MTWKDIIKISNRERAEAEDFATEDMDDWRSDRERNKLEMKRLAGREYAERMKAFVAKTKEFIQVLKSMGEEDSVLLIGFFVEKMELEIAKENPSKDNLKRWHASILQESRTYENYDEAKHEWFTV